MPSSSQLPPYDKEWAQSLEGLWMKVPENWWDGYNGKSLSSGRIVSIDFDSDGSKFFQLELNDELGALYPMRYDAVVKY